MSRHIDFAIAEGQARGTPPAFGRQHQRSASLALFNQIDQPAILPPAIETPSPLQRRSDAKRPKAEVGVGLRELRILQVPSCLGCRCFSALILFSTLLRRRLSCELQFSEAESSVSPVPGT